MILVNLCKKISIWVVGGDSNRGNFLFGGFDDETNSENAKYN